MKLLNKLEQQFRAYHGENFNQESVQRALSETMDKIESLVKFESKKRETVGTLNKMLTFSKEKKQCYLCKSALDSQKRSSIQANFQVDNQNSRYEETISEEK